MAAATVATGRAALIMAGGIGIVGGLLGLMLQNGHLHGSDGNSNVVPGYFAAAGLAALVVLPEAAAERKVADEFQRRKLVVPAGLLANGTVHGSLFFPPTPAAKTLELTFTGAGAPERVAIDLAAVRNLSRPPLR